ncbi:MAG TPA: uroporphyrinogen-III synthase [Candidatus Acidoferrum sp.]
MAERPKSPLAGKRVVITRPETQSEALAVALQSAGADVILLPLIRIEPPHDLGPLDTALRNLGSYDCLIFTSQNSVAAVSDRLSFLNLTTRPHRIAAVGKSTADAARAAGFAVAHNGHGTAADLVRELANELSGKRILLPRSDRAAASLVTQLQKTGAEVAEVIAYRTVAVDYSDSNALTDRADSILFFSPSAVHAFSVLAKSGVFSSIQAYGAVGAIGPVTRTALLETALPCDFEAQHPSVEEIVSALTAHFENRIAAPGVHSR